MKSFKQFIFESVDHGVVDGIPCAVILKPEHLSEEVHRMAKWALDASDNSHLGGTKKSQGDSLAWSHPISPDDRKHLYRYTKSSNTLNSDLYRRHMENDPVKHPATVPTKVSGEHHDVAALDKAVHQPLKQDVHVHSGVRFNPGRLARNHPEGHIHLPAYTSTSLDRQVANQFSDSGHILHIHLKAGDKARYVGADSHYPHEKEVLLPRHTTIKVHPEPDVVQGEGGTKVHVWHAHVVHQAHPDEIKPQGKAKKVKPRSLDTTVTDV
jgi:hypothetical protein